MENQITIKQDVGQQVIDRVNKLSECGMTFAPDYSYINAIKASVIALQATVDKDKRPALEVCTKSSIQSALFEMVTKSLDVSKKQAYFIIRGDKLCLHVSYFGHILQVKRLYPNWVPVANTIREGDEFIYGIDTDTGKKKLIKHEQKLENLDKDFVGAYVFLPCPDGTNELYIMTRKQIMTAWSKSSNKSMTVHKEFDEKMILKTVINSGCQKVINSTPTTNATPADDDPQSVQDPIKGGLDSEPYAEFQEVTEQPATAPQTTATTTDDATITDDEF